VSGSWDHRSLGSESSGEHITNGLEHRRVPARDYQGAESSLCEIIERDLRVITALQRYAAGDASWRSLVAWDRPEPGRIALLLPRISFLVIGLGLVLVGGFCASPPGP
jgi:hypothetical protein